MSLRLDLNAWEQLEVELEDMPMMTVHEGSKLAGVSIRVRELKKATESKVLPLFFLPLTNGRNIPHLYSLCYSLDRGGNAKFFKYMLQMVR